MKKNKIFILGAALLLVIVNLLSSVDKESYFSNINLSKIQAANAEDTETSGIPGTRRHENCLLMKMNTTKELFKWYVNGEAHYSLVDPGAGIEGGVDRETVTATVEIWGSEYVCDGLYDCNKPPTDCYATNIE